MTENCAWHSISFIYTHSNSLQLSAYPLAEATCCRLHVFPSGLNTRALFSRVLTKASNWHDRTSKSTQMSDSFDFSISAVVLCFFHLGNKEKCTPLSHKVISGQAVWKSVIQLHSFTRPLWRWHIYGGDEGKHRSNVDNWVLSVRGTQKMID